MEHAVDVDKPKKKKRFALFTPIRRAMRVEMNEYNGGQLGEIYFNKTGKSLSGKHVINKQNSRQFVEGLVAAHVMEAHYLLLMLDGSDEVIITFEEA